MPDFYPSEKGVIRRDRTGEARDVLARELMMESLGMIPIGGMAAKMSSPAVDVLGRWIRRFRKDKPPTVPLKNIEKALKHEYERRTRKGLDTHSFDDHLIEQRSYMGPENLPVPSERFRRHRSLIHRPLGAEEKEPFDQLWKFSRDRLVGLPGPLGEITRSFVRKSPKEVFSEELARNWRKK
jgi:hypothetical protein